MGARESGGERPSEEILKAYRKFTTAILADALDSTNIMQSVIRPLLPKVQICGPAFTIRCSPGDNLMCHYALYEAKPGDVLVVDGGAYTEEAIWGGLTSLSAAQRNLGGSIIDGAVRDLRQMEKIGYPVYSRATTPRSPSKWVERGEVSVPVTCGGITVFPGDLVFGDEDGVVVVPSRKLAQVAEKANEYVAKEVEMAAIVNAGKTLYEYLEMSRYLEEEEEE
jgi:4-hydroxy-4-methyl-2-oxoglutarate aldolase